MGFQRFTDDSGNSHPGIEGCEGILENHLKLLPGAS
jgi:hypothetical protein